jgi:uncharacterized protein YndB with AHSA1/START domain
MARYRFTIHVDAPPAQVFDLWTNLERMHEWTEGVTKVTDVTGPVDQAGSRYTVWFGRMASRSEVLEADRPRLFRTRFGNRLLRGQAVATFEPESGGTRLTQEFETEGLIPAIAARIFATGSYKGSFRGELETFRKLAEREANAEQGS